MSLDRRKYDYANKLFIAGAWPILTFNLLKSNLINIEEKGHKMIEHYLSKF